MCKFTRFKLYALRICLKHNFEMSEFPLYALSGYNKVLGIFYKLFVAGKAMETIMNNRNIIRFASFSLCFIAVIVTYAISGNMESRKYQAKLEAVYQANLTELAECLDQIETNLTKSAYASSPAMMARLSEDLYSECNTAKNAMSQLPLEQMNLSGAYKFLSQASDYAGYLSSKIRTGTEISDDELKNMHLLLSYAKNYSKNVSDMVNKCAYGNKITENQIKAKGTNSYVSSLSLDFTQAEETFADYPTLIYDGPFADAVLNKESQMIKNAKEISREQAAEIAARILNTSVDALGAKSDEVGNIPCYVFSCDDRTIGITKNGGYPAYILNSKSVSEKSITADNAKNIAADFLKKIGYENMKSTYYSADGNVCLINFAYNDNNITCYSDLIKVGISLSNGEIYSMEAVGYLTNHIQRNFDEAGIMLDDAASGLSKSTDLLSSKLAYIPLRNGKEALCYEFLCRNRQSGEDVLIYINTQSGEEEDILLLLYSDNGTLTK